MRKFNKVFQLARCKELTASDRIILMIILDCEINLGFQYLPLSVIQKESGFAKNTILKSIRYLIDLGLVTKIESSEKKNIKAANYYEPNIENIEALLEGSSEIEHPLDEGSSEIEHPLDEGSSEIEQRGSSEIEHNTNPLTNLNKNNILKENTKEKEETVEETGTIDEIVEQTPSIEEIEEREFELIKEYCITQDDLKLTLGIKKLYRPIGWNNNDIAKEVLKIKEAFVETNA